LVDPPNVERKLAAIMFTDIVGYTALMAESEQAGLRVRPCPRKSSLFFLPAQQHRHSPVADGAGSAWLP
jgi:hypothetical protein